MMLPNPQKSAIFRNWMVPRERVSPVFKIRHLSPANLLKPVTQNLRVPLVLANQLAPARVASDEGRTTPMEVAMLDDLIREKSPAHYTEQRLRRNPHYRGRAECWSEDEANAALVELIKYFGLDYGGRIPPPPTGLPGTGSTYDEDALNLLRIGFSYVVAIANREPRSQWNAHHRLRDALTDRYFEGREALRVELTEEAVSRARTQYDTGQATRKEQLVYFIGGVEGPIKIGRAADPSRRMAELQTSHHQKLSIFATCEGGSDQETAYHKHFAAHRLHGEWFERCPELEAEIARLSPSPQVYRGGGM